MIQMMTGETAMTSEVDWVVLELYCFSIVHR